MRELPQLHNSKHCTFRRILSQHQMFTKKKVNQGEACENRPVNLRVAFFCIRFMSWVALAMTGQPRAC